MGKPMRVNATNTPNASVKLPSGWSSVRLTDVARLESGHTPARDFDAYWNGDVQWLSLHDTASLHNHVIHKTKITITQQGIANSSARLLPAGTVALSRTATIGKSVILGRVMATSQDFACYVPGENVCSKYLMHLFRFMQPTWRSLAGGSTHQTIYMPAFKALQVDLPPVPEQRLIAEILDTVDEAIRKTEAIIAKLGQVKQGLLHDLLTRGIDEHGQLRDPDRHPEQFKDSPLGSIPKEWEVSELQDVADVDRGKFMHRPRNDPAFYGGPFPFVQTGDVAAATGGTLDTFSQTLNDRGARVSSEFPAGTIAITIAANIADTAVLNRPMYMPDSIVGAVVRPPNNIRFTQLCVRRAKATLDARAPQSAQKNINLQDLRPLLIPHPSPEEQHRIEDVYNCFAQRLDSETSDLQKLRVLKQGLMDDLLTGRVRVTNLLQQVAK